MADPIQIARLRGRNGFDPPLEIPDDQAAEMLNLDLYEGQLGRKRGGLSADTMTFASGGPFTGSIRSLIRHVPGANEAAQELWAIDAAATPIVGRKAASTQYTGVTLKSNIAARPQDVSGVSFNGKLFFFGLDSAVNRTQLWDGSAVRYAGVGTPAAPVLATLGGAGLTFTRYVKVAYTVQSGGVTLRRSELSASATITITDDSGFSITKPASISEGETHWETYVADAEAGPYWLDATTVVGTTSYNYTDASIDTTTAAPLVGTNLVPPSAKFGASDGNRMLWYGANESSAGDSVEPKNGRVWFSAVLGAGTTSIGDDERIPIQTAAGGIRYYIDVGENDGGEPRGLAGPLHGSMYAFQSHGITELTPTGRANTPYRRYQLSRVHGAVSQKSIIEAPDAAGNPCLYFLSPKDGPRRIGANGLEWVGADVKDRWDLVNLDASVVVAHGIYHADINQIWWFVATGSSTTPDDVLVFDISEGISGFAEGMPAIRKGWTRFSGDVATAQCSVMFSTTPGATMARRLKPYIGTTTANTVSKCDTGDAAVQAYIDTKPYAIGSLTSHAEVTGATLLADAATGVPIALTVTGDFGAAGPRVDQVVLTPQADETKVVRTFEAPELAELATVQFRLGDLQTITNGWTLDALTVNVKVQEAIIP